MRKLILALAFSATITPVPGHAQAVNMTAVTCGQYLAMGPDQARVFSAWMSGWFNQRRGYAWVNPPHLRRTSVACGSGVPPTRMKPS